MSAERDRQYRVLHSHMDKIRDGSIAVSKAVAKVVEQKHVEAIERLGMLANRAVGDLMILHKTEGPASEELRLLRKVAAAGCDVALARVDREFADLNGGVDQLLVILTTHVARYERFISDNTDCRSVVQ